MVIWFGFGIPSKIIMAFLLVFFPILINAARGLTDIEIDMLDLMHLMRAKERQIFFKLRLPNALTYIFDGLKIGVPLAVAGAIIGEFVSSEKGLGNVILVTMNSLDIALMFGALICIAVIAAILFAAVVVLESKIIKWKPRER